MADDPAFDDAEVPVQPGRDEPPIGRTSATPGALLRKAREQAGMHLGVLASTLKVNPRKLEALEADRYEELPDAAFVRALALAVCRVLKCDPAPILEAYEAADLAADPLRRAGRGLNAPIARHGASGVNLRASSVRPGSRGRRWLWVLLVVVLIGLALAWWAPLWTGANGAGTTLGDAGAPPPALAAETAATSSSTTVVVPVAADDPSSTTVASVDLTGGVAAGAGGGGKGESKAAPGPGVAGSPAAGGAAAASMGAAGEAAVKAGASKAGAVGAGAVSAAAAEARLVITATKDSWIELSEASGRVVWARVLPAGQTLKPEAAPPLRLVVGNARATQVTFDGRSLDLEASARGNVARIDIR